MKRFTGSPIRLPNSAAQMLPKLPLGTHGACGYKALKESLQPGEVGFFCETAHPAKFKDTVEHIIGAPVEIPARLAAFMQGEKQSVALGKDFEGFKRFLLGLTIHF